MTEVQLEEGWKAALGDEFDQPYMRELKAFLRQEYAAGKTIFPKGGEYFAALNLTPFAQVKVIGHTDYDLIARPA